MVAFPTSTTRMLEEIRRCAQPLVGLSDVDRLLAHIGSARFVLMGEATHGTHEFYRMRIELSKRLIMDKGFDAVAVEADWPSALRASRYAQGGDADHSAETALHDFERFPRWMWRNTDVLEWLDWLRQRNTSVREPSAQVGFFGLDLYSLRDSMDAVLRYLDRADPEAAARARARYSCFDELAHDPQAYGHAVHFGVREDCRREVVQQLRDLCSSASTRFLLHDGTAATDELFYAQQNARVVRNAEAYYRTMFDGRTDSWNLRDRHMADTLKALDAHLTEQRGRPARIIVWAHNSHIGDARATESGERGQWNLGQLVREEMGAQQVFLLGFSTHTGTVAAASDWDAPVKIQPVQPSRADSIERVMHDSGLDRFMLPLREGSAALREALRMPRLQRAIGVIYRPDTERWSHYFDASIAEQFDALVHLDTTRAVQPLDDHEIVMHTEEPETYPSGL